MEFNAVYPAYNPRFEAHCSNCKKLTDSNCLLTSPDVPDELICDNCVFVYYHKDCRDIFIARDSKEIKNYPSLC